MTNGSFDSQHVAPHPFRDRHEAGRLLATRLQRFAGRRDVVVLALPRGGVPVAYEVATALGVPLDVFTVRKLGVPGHEELAMGAIASGETCILNPGVIEALGITRPEVAAVVERERREFARRELLYRDGRPAPNLEGKTVIVVDDGLATGASMLVALEALRKKNPQSIVVAVPTAPSETCAAMSAHADEVVCYATPDPFFGVGSWYRDFSQVTAAEVRTLLNHASLRSAS